MQAGTIAYHSACCLTGPCTFKHAECDSSLVRKTSLDALFARQHGINRHLDTVSCSLHLERCRWSPADHFNKTLVGTAATLAARFTHKWYKSGYDPAFPHDSGRVPAHRAETGAVYLP